MTRHIQILSPRQIEIRDLMLQGLMDKEIADELCISVETVANHIRALYRKLCIHSRTELFQKYMTRTCQLAEDGMGA